jgi:4-methylaminobutanoate oxidase (formaldehyde-forming)
VGEEHRAVRERVGIFDLSSFGKIDVTGPDAARLLERAAANRVDVETGRIVYTQFLDERGGIVADVTVARVAEDRFRVTTGAAAIDADLGWLRRVALDEGIDRVSLRDASDELAVIAVWGPRAPEVIAVAGARGLEDSEPMTGRAVAVGDSPAWAQAVSFAGEPGWELLVEPDRAVQLWDRLVDAGRDAGLEFCGYRCIDGLRIEKGMRYLGSDLTADDSPFEAGLDRFVAIERRDFLGRDALLRRMDAGIRRRLRTLLVGEGSAYVRLYGGEAVLAGGEVVGRVRSCAYGFTVERNVALAYLPSALGPGDQVFVDVFGEPVPASVAADVLVGARGRTAA